MDDVISRQAAIDAINKAFERVFAWDGTSPLGDKVLENVPSAQPEIIYCKDCKKQNKDYHMSPYKDTVCPLTAWRGTAQGHEYDYQFCCFAERKEVTT